MFVTYKLGGPTAETASLAVGDRHFCVDITTKINEIETTQTVELPEIQARQLVDVMNSGDKLNDLVAEYGHHNALLIEGVKATTDKLGITNPEMGLDGPTALMLLDDIRQYVGHLETRGWVDVSERLPEMYQEVPVLTECGVLRVARTDRKGTWQQATFVGAKHQYAVKVVKWFDAMSVKPIQEAQAKIEAEQGVF